MYAYVLIALDDASVEGIVEDFRDMEEVVEAHILFGEWDVILKVKSSEPEAIGSFVLEKIRSRDEVKLTSTLIVAR
jgi:Lrp/AsnC family transcriptional regulator, leucine-responsive regulatory protein